jgi:putative spermidine/putrescine transport system permease protein
MTHSTDSVAQGYGPALSGDPLLAASNGKGAKYRRATHLKPWLGIVPFMLFAFAFMVLPAGSILVGSIFNKEGALSLENFVTLLRPDLLQSYLVSIEVSAVTALGGGIIGFLLSYAITLGGLPQGIQTFLTTFSGVASNFAGVPLAFAFISTLGRVGMITVLLKSIFGFDLYEHGFNLYSFWGLSVTYMYFQIPLMLLIINPAIQALKREWREACENLGASAFQYWRYVGLPILAPSFLAAVILLFGNAFGAYATAYALTGGLLNLTPIVIGAQIRGDVLHNPNLGYTLAMGMVIIMLLCIGAYTLLQRRASRWIK